MSKQYKDLKDYLNNVYYDLLINEAKGHLSSMQLFTRMIPNPQDTEVESVEITSLHTEFHEGDIINIQCNVRVDITISGFAYGNRHNDVESDSITRYLAMKLKARFTGAFEGMIVESVKNIDEKDRFSLKGSGTQSFVPYMQESDLDDYAKDFLKKYCPEALSTPIPLPIQTVTKKMGLQVRSANIKTEGVFGRCYFVDKEHKRVDGTIETISKGTIVYDRNSFFFNGIGSHNNTIIHECVHWEYHKKFFELMHLLNPKLTNISCTVLGTESQIESAGHEDFMWMEWQANALTPRILMPAETTKLKFEQIKADIVQNGETDIVKANKVAVRKLADFFNVTLTSAKIRLIELGYDYFRGIYDYIDNNETQAYAFNSKKIKAGQSFSIGLVDVATCLANSTDLRNCVNNKTIVYASGFFVINNKKYTYKNAATQKYELTDYALQHMDECCLVFDNEPKVKRAFDDHYYSMCYLCKTQGGQDTYRRKLNSSDYNNDIMRRSFELAYVIEDNKDALEILNELTGSFGNKLRTLMGKYNFSNRALSRECGIDDHKIAAILNNSVEPSKKEVIAIAAGMCLHPILTNALMDEAGVNLVLKKDCDATYHYLINHCYEEGLASWNERLRDADKIDWQLP